MNTSSIDVMQLLPVEELVKKRLYGKHIYNITKTNPFTTMNDTDWKEYVETHQPHFTSEPYYELVPWAKLQQLEVDARKAGWELILRTTNNTAYCPGNVGQQWCQRTQWLFGLPDMQFLIRLTYNEDRFTLLKDKVLKDGDIRSIPLSNYFSLEIIVRRKLIIRQKTEAEIQKARDDYMSDFEDTELNIATHVKYYAPIKPASGWKTNNLVNCDYIGFPNEKDCCDNDSNENIMNRIKPTFWSEWIEYNKDSVLPGKFAEDLQITHWSDTFVLPGNRSIEYNIDTILEWNMDFIYLQQLLQTNFNNWVDKFYGYNCCGTIPNRFWTNIILGFYDDSMEMLQKTCIIEGQVKDGSLWQPIDGYRETLYQFKHIRLSENASTLIKQALEYVQKQNA